MQMNQIKLLIIFLFLIIFSAGVFSQNINDFQYTLDLNINPNENLGGGRPILVVVDTTDVQKFPFKECLAVSFNDSIIGREIEDFGSAFARLKFNLINSISANSLNQDYKILTGCDSILPENNSFTENWETIPSDSSNSASSGWPVNASASNGSVSISNDYSVASGSGSADASMSNSLKREWNSKMSFSYSLDAGGMRPDCISVSGSANSSLFGLWSGSLSNGSTSGGDSYEFRYKNKNEIDYRKNSGSWNSVNFSGNSISFSYSISESRGGFCNSEHPSSSVSHGLYKAVKFAVPDYETSGGSAGQGWNHLSSKPDFNIIAPSSNTVISNSDDSDFIEFLFSDDDENQSIMADIYYHFQGEPSFSNPIIQNVVLNTSSNCNDSDNNTATPQVCSFDWNSFPLNSKNLFLDVRLKDPYYSVEKTFSFQADNLSPVINYFSFPVQTTENNFTLTSQSITDVTDFDSKMSFSCDGLSFTAQTDFNNDFNSFDFTDTDYGCSANEGVKTIYLNVCDAFNQCSLDVNEITYDKLPELNSSLQNGFFNGNIDFNIVDSFPGGIDFNSLEITIDSFSIIIQNNECTSITNGFECSVNSNLLQEKNYLINILGKSISGQLVSKQFTAFLDKTNPTIDVTAPQENQTLQSSSVSLTYTFSDNNAVQETFFSLDSEKWTSNSLNNSYSFTGLVNGTHSIKVKVLDKAGNETEDEVSFFVSVENDDDDDVTKEEDDDEEITPPIRFSGGGGGGAVGSPYKPPASAVPSEGTPEDAVKTETEDVSGKKESFTHETIQAGCRFSFSFEHPFPSNEKFPAEISEDYKTRENSLNETISFSEKELTAFQNCELLKSENIFALISFDGKEYAVEFINGVIVSFFETGGEEDFISLPSFSNENATGLISFSSTQLLYLIPVLLALILALFYYYEKNRKKQIKPLAVRY